MNAAARDPETGHRMRVFWSDLLSVVACQFDDEEPRAVPPEIQAFNKPAAWMACELLRVRLNVDAWSEEEELTLS